MDSNTIYVFVMSSLLGVILIGLGLTFSLGINRTWWRARFLSIQEGYFWASIPAGMTAISWAIAALFPTMSPTQDIFFYAGIFFFVIAVIFSFAPPKFLKPQWLRDLENRYPRYIKQLREEARQLSKEEWQEIVHDPERLQRWAAETVRNPNR